MRLLSPQAILQKLADRPLDLLHAGSQDLPKRQQTLRDTIAWSYSLLPADAQTLFARLAVFEGSAGLDAIEKVANPDGRFATLDVLASLVDSSLVRAVGEAAAPRFAMLSTIREFAAERLDASVEAEVVRMRHEAYFVELAQRGGQAPGSANVADWTEGHPNFMAVFRRALRRGDTAVAVRLGRAMMDFWNQRGWYSQGRDWMRDASVWDTLELWATAELRDGRPERAARLFALAQRGYDQTTPQPGDPRSETHDRLDSDLRAALGDRYDKLVADGSKLEFDAALDALAATDTAG